MQRDMCRTDALGRGSSPRGSRKLLAVQAVLHRWEKRVNLLVAGAVLGNEGATEQRLGCVRDGRAGGHRAVARAAGGQYRCDAASHPELKLDCAAQEVPLDRLYPIIIGEKTRLRPLQRRSTTSSRG